MLQFLAGLHTGEQRVEVTAQAEQGIRLIGQGSHALPLGLDAPLFGFRPAPAKLRGVNLQTGREAWSIEVREVVYRGSAPP